MPIDSTPLTQLLTSVRAYGGDRTELDILYSLKSASRAWLAFEFAALLAEQHTAGDGPGTRLAALITATGMHGVVGQTAVYLDNADVRNQVLAECLLATRGYPVQLTERWLVSAEAAHPLKRWHGSHALGTVAPTDQVAAGAALLRESGFDVTQDPHTTIVTRERKDGGYNRLVGAAMLPLAPLAGKRGIARAAAMIRGKNAVDRLTIAPTGLTVEVTVGDAPVSSFSIAAPDIVAVCGVSRPLPSGGREPEALRVVQRDRATELLSVDDATVAHALSTVTVAGLGYTG